MNHHALSVDLEDYFHVSNFDGVIERKHWPDLPTRVEQTTHRLLDGFDAKATKATFFVLGWVAERQPALVREIAERGHEIACHGYGHQLVYDLGPEKFRADIRRARQIIEDTTGVAPTGYRAPSYSITEASLWALRILAEESFRYDSSIFPIRHYRYGIPSFPKKPLNLDLGDGQILSEYPLTTVQQGPVVLPVAGGAYLRFMPGVVFRHLFAKAAKQGPTVLYLHPWEIDPEQPKQDVSLRVRVNHYYNLGRTEARLLRLLDAHPFAPLADVLARLDAEGALPTLSLEEAVAGEKPAGSETAEAHAA